MRSRIDILIDLVQIKRNLSDLQSELSQYSWDVEEPILIITKADFLNVLKRCINEDITFDELEIWANTIECRDDIDFEEKEMQEIIFELANPEINEKITKERLMQILNELA